jgi:hypothetical protein
MIVRAVNPKPLEKVSPASQDGLKRAEQQSLAEAAGPGQEIWLGFLEELVKELGFVGVKATALDELGKVSDSVW